MDPTVILVALGKQYVRYRVKLLSGMQGEWRLPVTKTYQIRKLSQEVQGFPKQGSPSGSTLSSFHLHGAIEEKRHSISFYKRRSCGRKWSVSIPRVPLEGKRAEGALSGKGKRYGAAEFA